MAWDRWFSLLGAFVEREGHARVPQSHVEEGRRLGMWVSVQRQAYRRGGLGAERIRRLESMPGWLWFRASDAVAAALWGDRLSLLAAFVAREGHGDVPLAHTEAGVALGRWVASQRTAYRKGRLLAERAQRLEALAGWTWARQQRAPQDTTRHWDAMFALLESFVAQQGHAQVPRSHQEAGRPLGRWVASQRYRYHQGLLEAERAWRLKSLDGWSWSPLASMSGRLEGWDGTYSLLESFVAREGHARVPRRHVESGRALGDWAKAQRRAYRQGRLGADRARRLEALPGWVWNPSPGDLG